MGKGNSPKLDETKELMILERSKLTVWSLFNSSLTTLVKKIHFFAQPRGGAGPPGRHCHYCQTVSLTPCGKGTQD